MKLLFIYYDGADYFGGPIVHARRLLPDLRRRGHEIHCLVFQLDNAAPTAAWLEQQGIRCRLRQFSTHAGDHIRWILAQVADIQPDVFVPNLSVAGFYAARWVRSAGIPTVAVHYSDDDFHWAMVSRFVCGDPAWAVSALVCVGDELRERTARLAPAHTRVCTIPLGIPVGSEHSAQEGPLQLVYVGRLNQKQKRIHDLVDALALLLGIRKDISATLIGSGKERPAVEERIDRHGLHDRIRLAGTISSETIQSELRRYHVQVLLSDFEGTPIALMDGMAAGLVPVCLDIPGGVRELVIHERTGLLVRDRGQDFVDAVLRLADDAGLRRRLAAGAREHVRMHFSAETATDQWETLCAELASECGPRSPIGAPWRIVLPPPLAAFNREDQRSPSILNRLARIRKYIAGKLTARTPAAPS